MAASTQTLRCFGTDRGSGMRKNVVLAVDFGFRPFTQEHVVQSRIWKAAAVLIVGDILIAVALASDDLRWVGWTGLMLAVAGAVGLALATRAGSEITPTSAREPIEQFRPAHPTAADRTSGPTPSSGTTTAQKKADLSPTRATSPGRAHRDGAFRPERDPAGLKTGAEVSTDAEPDPSVVDLLAAVPGLGPTKQRSLAAAFPTMEQLQHAAIEDLTAIDRVGPRVASRIKFLTDATIETLLAEVSHVGPGKRQALADRFESAPRLMRATVDEIAAVDGVSPAMASRIRESLDSPR